MKERVLKTLDRVVSKAGLGSRTEARSWIGKGRVRVNGKLIQTPDHWVDVERDKVTLDGKPITRAKQRYLLLYKPKGYITTYRDPQGRPTVYDLIPDLDQFVGTVGRLDLDTSGLLLLSNDNVLAEALTNPEHKIPKTYLIKVTTNLTYQHRIDTITIGVTGRSDIERAIDRPLESIFHSALLAQAITMQVLESISEAGYVCILRQPNQAMIDAAWADAHEEDARGVWQSMVQVFDQSTGNSFSGKG